MPKPSAKAVIAVAALLLIAAIGAIALGGDEKRTSVSVTAGKDEAATTTTSEDPLFSEPGTTEPVPSTAPPPTPTSSAAVPKSASSTATATTAAPPWRWPLPSNTSNARDAGVYAVGADGRVLRKVAPANQFGVAASPDSRRVAYVTDHKLHLVNLDGTSDRAVAGLPRVPAYVDPEWSPDGSWVAVVTLDGAGNYRLHIVPTDAGPPRLLGAGLSGVSAISWARDGQSLAASAGNGVHRVPVDGGTTTRIADIPATGPARTLRFSPDGTHLAYAVYDALVVLDADGSNPRTVAQVPSGSRAFDWSPDGTRLVHTVKPRGLAVTTIEGNSSALVADGGHTPAWSRGDLIAFKFQSGPGLSPVPIQVIRPDGSDRRELLADPGPGPFFAEDQRWSPSGEFVLFTSGTGGDGT